MIKIIDTRYDYLSTGFEIAEKGLSTESGFVTQVNLIDDDSVQVAFDNKILHIWVEGECCSHSFFEDPNQFKDLIGKTIHSIEHRSGEGYQFEYEGYSEVDTIIPYFLVFVTDKGHITIDWRNENNGYYCGTINFTVMDLDPEPAKVEPPTKDEIERDQAIKAVEEWLGRDKI